MGVKYDDAQDDDDAAATWQDDEDGDDAVFYDAEEYNDHLDDKDAENNDEDEEEADHHDDDEQVDNDDDGESNVGAYGKPLRARRVFDWQTVADGFKREEHALDACLGRRYDVDGRFDSYDADYTNKELFMRTVEAAEKWKDKSKKTLTESVTGETKRVFACNSGYSCSCQHRVVGYYSETRPGHSRLPTPWAPGCTEPRQQARCRYRLVHKAAPQVEGLH
jgi:hypothetical protein